jgi:hypothetical protein
MTDQERQRRRLMERMDDFRRQIDARHRLLEAAQVVLDKGTLEQMRIVMDGEVNVYKLADRLRGKKRAARAR